MGREFPGGGVGMLFATNSKDRAKALRLALAACLRSGASARLR